MVVTVNFVGKLAGGNAGTMKANLEERFTKNNLPETAGL